MTTPAPRAQNKTALVIAIVLAVLGVLIAVGGGAAILWLRSTGPNDAYEVFVTRDVPLGAGDMVTFTEGNRSCSNVSVLGTVRRSTDHELTSLS